MEFEIGIKVIKQPDVLEQSSHTCSRMYGEDHSLAAVKTDLEENLPFPSLVFSKSPMWGNKCEWGTRC